MGRLLGICASVSLLLVAALPGLAHAQSPPAAGVVEPETAIIVTARRRSESVQDIPIAISTVDSRTLETTGSFNVNRLTQLLPSVQFFSSNPRNSSINISWTRRAVRPYK